MNRNIIHEIQNSVNFFQDNNNYKSKDKKLLCQQLPKYRKQIFKKTVQNYGKDRRFKIRQKNMSFGEEDFLKKLKQSSTKQIDRKSAKVIQKYLQQLNQQKVNSEGNLKRVHSLKCFSQIYPHIFNQNEQSFQDQHQKALGKDLSMIVPTNIKAKSTQTIINGKKKNNDDTNYEVNTNQEELGILLKHKHFEDKNEGKRKRQKIEQDKKNKIFENISFRNNSLNYSDFYENEDQNIEQLIQTISHQNQKNYMQSSNNFYYKHNYQSPVITQKLVPNSISVNKQRPTNATNENIQSLNQIANQRSPYHKYKNQQQKIISRQIDELRIKTREQKEIIRLQEIMIEKLNDQLQKALTRIQIREQKNRKSFSIFPENRGNVSESKHRELALHIKDLQQKWEVDMQNLQNVLRSMEFDLQDDNIKKKETERWGQWRSSEQVEQRSYKEKEQRGQTFKKERKQNDSQQQQIRCQKRLESGQQQQIIQELLSDERGQCQQQHQQQHGHQYQYQQYQQQHQYQHLQSYQQPQQQMNGTQCLSGAYQQHNEQLLNREALLQNQN